MTSIATRNTNPIQSSLNYTAIFNDLLSNDAYNRIKGLVGSKLDAWEKEYKKYSWPKYDRNDDEDEFDFGDSGDDDGDDGRESDFITKEPQDQTFNIETIMKHISSAMFGVAILLANKFDANILSIGLNMTPLDWMFYGICVKADLVICDALSQCVTSFTGEIERKISESKINDKRISVISPQPVVNTSSSSSFMVSQIYAEESKDYQLSKLKTLLNVLNEDLAPMTINYWYKYLTDYVYDCHSSGGGDNTMPSSRIVDLMCNFEDGDDREPVKGVLFMTNSIELLTLYMIKYRNRRNEGKLMGVAETIYRSVFSVTRYTICSDIHDIMRYELLDDSTQHRRDKKVDVVFSYRALVNCIGYTFIVPPALLKKLVLSHTVIYDLYKAKYIDLFTLLDDSANTYDNNNDSKTTTSKNGKGSDKNFTKKLRSLRLCVNLLFQRDDSKVLLFYSLENKSGDSSISNSNNNYLVSINKLASMSSASATPPPPTTTSAVRDDIIDDDSIEIDTSVDIKSNKSKVAPASPPSAKKDNSNSKKSAPTTSSSNSSKKSSSKTSVTSAAAATATATAATPDVIEINNDKEDPIISFTQAGDDDNDDDDAYMECTGGDSAPLISPTMTTTTVTTTAAASSKKTKKSGDYSNEELKREEEVLSKKKKPKLSDDNSFDYLSKKDQKVLKKYFNDNLMCKVENMSKLSQFIEPLMKNAFGLHLLKDWIRNNKREDEGEGDKLTSSSIQKDKAADLKLLQKQFPDMDLDEDNNEYLGIDYDIDDMDEDAVVVFDKLETREEQRDFIASYRDQRDDAARVKFVKEYKNNLKNKKNNNGDSATKVRKATTTTATTKSMFGPSLIPSPLSLDQSKAKQHGGQAKIVFKNGKPKSSSSSKKPVDLVSGSEDEEEEEECVSTMSSSEEQEVEEEETSESSEEVILIKKKKSNSNSDSKKRDKKKHKKTHRRHTSESSSSSSSSSEASSKKKRSSKKSTSSKKEPLKRLKKVKSDSSSSSSSSSSIESTSSKRGSGSKKSTNDKKRKRA